MLYAHIWTGRPQHELSRVVSRQRGEETEQSLYGPKMSPEMMKKYVSRVQKQLTKSDHENELMGSFRKKKKKKEDGENCGAADDQISRGRESEGLAFREAG